MGGCLLSLCGCGPCVMCFDAPQVAQKSNTTEGGIKAKVDEGLRGVFENACIIILYHHMII